MDGQVRKPDTALIVLASGTASSETNGARLTCYSGASFDPELAGLVAGDPVIQPAGLDKLYG